MKYSTDVHDPHEHKEEMQWAEIMASGIASAGMAVVFIQKLCTAFHELGPAYDAGALKDEQLAFFKTRMANRIRKVISVLENNGMENLDGLQELRKILQETENSASMKDLASLTEPVHMANHRLSDALLLLCKAGHYQK